MLRNVDRLTGEMRRGDVPFSRSRVAVDVNQMLLEFDRANGRVDLQRRMEVSVVSTGQRSQKLCSPRPAVTSVQGQPLINLQGVRSRKRDQETLAAHAQQIVITLNTIQAVTFGYHVLANQDVMRPSKRRRDDQTAALVVKTRQKDRTGCLLLHASQMRPLHNSS